MVRQDAAFYEIVQHPHRPARVVDDVHAYVVQGSLQYHGMMNSG
jgi:hypothetical protein